MARLTLRPYQQSALDAHYRYFEENREGNPLFVLPTGSGKAALQAEFIRQSLKQWPNTRFLMVTHSSQLVQQNYDEFLGQWDSAIHPAGIYSAGIGRREGSSQVLFAGIQSIYDKDVGSFDLVLVDEAHAIPKTGHGRYQTYLTALKVLNPKVRVVGYTATPYRMQGGYLHRGRGAMFTDIAYEVPLDVLVPEFLLPLVSAKHPKHSMNTSHLKVVRGEFEPKQMEAMALSEADEATDESVAIAREQGRKSWLFFCCTIDHAERVLERLKYRDVSCDMVTGKTPKSERVMTLAKFKSQNMTALVNVGVLTTGYNAPCIDMLVIMRATQSTSLFIQICGRGMRKFPGLADCLVMDFGENILRHGPINRVVPKIEKTGDGLGEPPVRICDNCQSYVMMGAIACPECGYVFPRIPREITHDRKASTAKILDFDTPKEIVQPSQHPVSAMHLRTHLSASSGKNTLRVDYICGVDSYTDWVCLEHEYDSYPQQKAKRWWKEHGGRWPIPAKVSQAIERQNEIAAPLEIVTAKDGKYDKIKKRIWSKEGRQQHERRATKRD